MLDDSGEKVKFCRRSSRERRETSGAQLKRKKRLLHLIFIFLFFLILLPVLLAIAGAAYNGFAGAVVLAVWVFYILPVVPLVCIGLIIWYRGPDLLRGAIVDCRRDNDLCGACGYVLCQESDGVNGYIQCPECGAKWRL